MNEQQTIFNGPLHRLTVDLLYYGIVIVWLGEDCTSTGLFFGFANYRHPECISIYTSVCGIYEEMKTPCEVAEERHANIQMISRSLSIKKNDRKNPDQQALHYLPEFIQSAHAGSISPSFCHVKLLMSPDL